MSTTSTSTSTSRRPGRFRSRQRGAADGRRSVIADRRSRAPRQLAGASPAANRVARPAHGTGRRVLSVAGGIAAVVFLGDLAS